MVKVPSATGASCVCQHRRLVSPLQALALSSVTGDGKMSSFLTAEVAHGNPTGNPIPGHLTSNVLPKGGSGLVEKPPHRKDRDDSIFKLSPRADRAPSQ